MASLSHLSPIRPELSRINSNNSEDESRSGYSWKQGNSQGPG